jgi:hypothetical protein
MLSQERDSLVSWLVPRLMLRAIQFQIVQPDGNTARWRRREVMVVHLDGLPRVQLAVAVEVPQQLFLLSRRCSSTGWRLPRIPASAGVFSNWALRSG